MEVDEENNPVRGRRIIPPRSQQHCEKKLLDLQQNETKHFTISEDGYPELDESDFTIEQWNCLFTELEKNSSVEIVTVQLRCCRPVECLDLFVHYIATSQTIKNLIIMYMSQDANYGDEQPDEIPEHYMAKIDDILRAVRQNLSIQNLHLHCLGNPQAMEDLLAGNDSLKQLKLFMYKYDDTSKAMATSIATGFKRNNALQQIYLVSFEPRIDDGDDLFGLHENDNDTHEDRGWHLDIMISGLCHPKDDSSSNLELLSLYPSYPKRYPNLVGRVSEAIKCTPSLKTLVLIGDDYDDGNDDVWPRDEAWSVSVLKNLRGPEYAGLKNLVLEAVSLGGINRRNFENDTIMAGSNRILPSDQVNMTLERLDLVHVRFPHQNAMELFWNLRGLRQLNIVNAEMLNTTQWMENDDTSNAPDYYWAECFRCCAQLCQVDIDLSNSIRRPEDNVDVGVSDMFTSILNGARGHTALQHLKLSVGDAFQTLGSNDVGVLIPEGRLRRSLQQLLRETSSLKDLFIMGIGP